MPKVSPNGNHLHLAEFYGQQKGPVMKAKPNTKTRSDRLAVNIRRTFASETNLRVLESLPVFRAEGDLPPGLQRLLDKLQEVERRQPKA